MKKTYALLFQFKEDQSGCAQISIATPFTHREVGSVQILPVTKRQPLEAVGFAHRLGLAGGENVVQRPLLKSRFS